MPNYTGLTPARYKDTQNRVTYVAAAGQTVFAAQYAPGYVDVYKNGNKLKGPNALDFTATNGTSITLSTPAALNDFIEIISLLPSAPYDFYTKAQTDAKVANYYAIATGTADALAVVTTPAIAALADGTEVRLRTASSNATTTPTITFTQLALTKTVTGPGGAALTAGAWATGQEITVRFNQAGNRLELITPNVTFASGVQAASGTSTNTVVTPAALAGAFTSQRTAAASGYQKLPGGLILQWGNVTTSASGDTTVTFPTAFTTLYSITTGVNGTGANIGAMIPSSSATNFTVSAYNGSTRQANLVWWQAIGV